MIRQHELVKIEKELGEKNVDELYNRIIEYFLQKSKPHIFDPHDENCVVFMYDREIEELCISMEENGINNPKDLTVFEFYSRIRYYEKKAIELKSKK